jgi:hypothetical protein
MQGLKDGATPFTFFERMNRHYPGAAMMDVIDITATEEFGVEMADIQASLWRDVVDPLATPGAEMETVQEVEETEPVVKSFTTVGEDYFNDALFIGDSRTVGLSLYSGWDNATYYVQTGLTIWTIFDKPIVEVPDSKQKITIREALSQDPARFRKIYLQVGVNELGRGTVDTFFEEYTKVVKELHELQPYALVFVQGIIHFSKEKAASSNIFNNTNINIRNANIATLADDISTFYIDVNEVISDGEGNLIASYTFDGIHLKAEYIQIWKDYLLAHGIQMT